MYIYNTSGGGSRGKTSSGLRKSALSGGGEIHPWATYRPKVHRYICMDTTLVVTVVCEAFVHMMYLLYHTNIFVWFMMMIAFIITLGKIM